MKILNWNKAAQFSCEGFKAYFTHAFTVIWLLDRLDHSHFHHSPLHGLHGLFYQSTRIYGLC